MKRINTRRARHHCPHAPPDRMRSPAGVLGWFLLLAILWAVFVPALGDPIWSFLHDLFESGRRLFG